MAGGTPRNDASGDGLIAAGAPIEAQCIIVDNKETAMDMDTMKKIQIILDLII